MRTGYRINTHSGYFTVYKDLQKIRPFRYLEDAKQFIKDCEEAEQFNMRKKK